MKPCIHQLKRMNAVLDGEATPGEEAELTAHLTLCPPCAALFEDLKALREEADSLVTPAPDGFAEAVMAQVRAEAAPPKLQALPKRSTWMSALALAAVCAIALLGSGALKYLQPIATPDAARLAVGAPVQNSPLPGQGQDQADPVVSPAGYSQQQEPVAYSEDSTGNAVEPAVSSPSPGLFSRNAGGQVRQALDLVVERTYGGSGYTIQATYDDDGPSCAVILLDGETVIDKGQITYTGLSPNEKFYCFSWTWKGQSAEEAALFRYAVPLDLSYVMWAGDGADSGEFSFDTTLEATD